MFESVLGHEIEKKILENDIKQKKVSHAYLFSGIEGIGKRMLALEFAKVILNTNNLNACADYKYIEKLPDKKEIIVEQIRDKIVNDLYIAPAAGDKKVYIINDAQTLNMASQNALLKTLEEPPEYVVIILITNSEAALLTTVLSRVKEISFSPLSKDIIESTVKNLTGEVLSNSDTLYTGGSLKFAIDLSKKQEFNKYIKIRKLYEYILTKDRLNGMKTLEEISFKDEETFKYLEHLLLIDKKYNKIKVVEDARIRMTENANEDIAKTAFILKMIKEGW